MKVHTIRLGEPWERTLLMDGRVRYRRRFGRPRTLDAGERLWLVCDRPRSVTVNGTELSTAERYDITDLLRSRNEVVLDTASDEPLGTMTLEVWRSAEDLSEGV